MKKLLLLVLCLAAISVAHAQVYVTGTTPANNATSVDTILTVAYQFNTAMDTTGSLDPSNSFLTNIKDVRAEWWSTDRRTYYITLGLKPNTSYFAILFYAKSATGTVLSTPYASYFTTAPSFPAGAFSVSGTVSGGTTGYTPGYSMVVLSSVPFNGGEPKMQAGAVADAFGNFSVPYVLPGVYYPLATRDVAGAGGIDPNEGDPLAIGDSVTVTSANISGMLLTLQQLAPVRFAVARDSILAAAARLLPAQRTLKMIEANGIDSVGGASRFKFMYLSRTSVYSEIRYSGFTPEFQDAVPGQSHLDYHHAIPDPSAVIPLDTVIARVEALGGRAFRHYHQPGDTLVFRADAWCGDIRYEGFWDLYSDTTRNYWGVAYGYYWEVSRDSVVVRLQQRYAFDALTGAVMGHTAIGDNPGSGVAATFALGQNYPNPFNPSTRIDVTIGGGVKGNVSLVVYDMLGRVVATLMNGEYPAGRYTATFEAPRRASGVYFYRLTAGGRTETRTMLLLK